jgi:hypothetical protein
MRSLSLDVGDKRLEVDGSDGLGPVADLPDEPLRLGQREMESATRGSLQPVSDLRDRDARWMTDQDMDVVGAPTAHEPVSASSSTRTCCPITAPPTSWSAAWRRSPASRSSAHSPTTSSPTHPRSSANDHTSSNDASVAISPPEGRACANPRAPGFIPGDRDPLADSRNRRLIAGHFFSRRGSCGAPRRARRGTSRRASARRGGSPRARPSAARRGPCARAGCPSCCRTCT